MALSKKSVLWIGAVIVIAAIAFWSMQEKAEAEVVEPIKIGYLATLTGEGAT